MGLRGESAQIRSWLEPGTDPAEGELGDKSPPPRPETYPGPVTSDRPGRGLGTDQLRLSVELDPEITRERPEKVLKEVYPGRLESRNWRQVTPDLD